MIAHPKSLGRQTRVLLVAALFATPALSQVQVQDGNALDANQQVGGGGYNQPGAQVDYRARNLLVTGDVGGGQAFRGQINYSSEGSFHGNLGSDSLFNFNRDSIYSAPGGLGGYSARQIGSQVIVTRPTTSVPGYQFPGGSALDTRAAYDPTSGVLTFRQSGGGLVSLTGLKDPTALRNTTSLGLVRTPGGLVSINASPLTGVNYETVKPTTSLTPRLDYSTGKPTAIQPEPVLENDSTTDPNNPSLNLNPRIDGTYKPAPIEDPTLNPTASKDPLALMIGSQLQSQMSLSLAGRTDNSIANAQAQAIRTQLFGNTATTEDNNKPPQAPQNPYDKLIADILAQNKGKTQEPTDQPDVKEEDNRPRWQQILEEPEKAVLEAKEKAREHALRISLGMIDEKGEVDYETPLPTIDPDSELGKLLTDLSYELPRVRTLASPDENRISTMMSRGEQELKEGRYIVAENLYRQILRETQGDPLAKAGLIHSQMGAGMIRSAAFNLRAQFSEHPELIALRYETKLLPDTERLRWLQGRLQKMISEEQQGADAGLVMAYMGYQLEAKPLIEFGLAVAQAAAPRDPLMPVLRQIWLEGEKAKQDAGK